MLSAGALSWVLDRRLPLADWIDHPWNTLGGVPAAAGIFRVTRNPIYLGLSLLLVGWALWLGSASPWLIAALLVALITRLQIIPEEQALGTLFGEQYLAYRRRTARWIGVAR
jgi:protein-S-isoprenylcysteine O-methyltransferase Ste14